MSNINEINTILKEIIDNKYNELNKYKEQGIFDKINELEGNAIGQIGKRFIKKIFTKLNIKMKDFGDVIHDESDIFLDDDEETKIEIKTARKGLKNNSLQFNGINPNYNCKYIICLGLTANADYFKIISGNKIYNHKERKFYLKVDNKEKQLVAMNPGNTANYKLTLQINNLEPIENIETQIKELFISN